MHTCLETIELREGVAQRLSYHWERMCNTWLLHGIPPPITMDHLQAMAEQGEESDPITRCTLTYTASGIIERRAIPYTPRVIDRLVAVEIGDSLDYSCKWADRDAFALIVKEHCLEKEEPILLRHGRVTDTTFTNIVTELSGRLVTPTAPLLRGTRRAEYLREQRIEEGEITLADLQQASQIYLINAMLPLGALAVREIRVTQTHA